MFKHLAVKKSLILLVAALMCVAVLLAACSEKPFTPNFDAPANNLEVGSNGGVAVTYGEWIYYVNGYESSVNADNTYANVNDDPRVGSVVRIKAADLADILKINDDDTLTSSQRTEKIAAEVRTHTQVVVPRFYFSGNTTTAELNGIYIFNNRLYILTPNDQLTAGGNPQTTQAVLMSYDLNGANEQRHFTFTSNAAQIWLYEHNNTVMATYLMDNQLHVLNVATGVDTALVDSEGENETVSSVTFDISQNSLGQCVIFLDSDGSICKLAKGATEKTVVIDNSTEDGEDARFTYTISSVANGFVYYTKADTENSSLDGTVLYYVNTNAADGNYTEKVALATANVTATGWKENNVVIVRQNDRGYYGLYIVKSQTGATVTLLQPGYNKDSITINKIDGDNLIYTAGGVTYIKKLSDFVENGEVVGNSEQETLLGTPYATSWSTNPSVGWAVPDIVTVGEHTYMFTLGTGSVTVVEFDAVKKTNGTSTTLTLTAEPDED